MLVGKRNNPLYLKDITVAHTSYMDKAGEAGIPTLLFGGQSDNFPWK